LNVSTTLPPQDKADPETGERSASMIARSLSEQCSTSSKRAPGSPCLSEHGSVWTDTSSSPFCFKGGPVKFGTAAGPDQISFQRQRFTAKGVPVTGALGIPPNFQYGLPDEKYWRTIDGLNELRRQMSNTAGLPQGSLGPHAPCETETLPEQQLRQPSAVSVQETEVINSEKAKNTKPRRSIKERFGGLFSKKSTRNGESKDDLPLKRRRSPCPCNLAPLSDDEDTDPHDSDIITSTSSDLVATPLRREHPKLPLPATEISVPPRLSRARPLAVITSEENTLDTNAPNG
jgi:hypothetical protein